MPEKITEQSSRYHHLEKMSVADLLKNINKEDKTIAEAVEKSIPQIIKLVESIVKKMLEGGRLFYIGAGTSGRLGIVDASECVPTFGIKNNVVTGIIAGGKKAFTKAAEFAEDSETQGWLDLQHYKVNKNDVVIGLSASGSAVYVINAIKKCSEKKIVTGCITCNPKTELAKVSAFPIEVITGPEFLTGSTRMKAGTAQKLVLNMISTSVMIKLGKVQDNKMVNMQLSNHKLIDRGTKMLMEILKINDYEKTKKLLLKYGSVQKTINHILK